MKKHSLSNEVKFLIDCGILASNEFNKDDFIPWDAYRLYFVDGCIAEESNLNNFIKLCEDYSDSIVLVTNGDDNIYRIYIDCEMY